MSYRISLVRGVPRVPEIDMTAIDGPTSTDGSVNHTATINDAVLRILKPSLIHKPTHLELVIFFEHLRHGHLLLNLHVRHTLRRSSGRCVLSKLPCVLPLLSERQVKACLFVVVASPYESCSPPRKDSKYLNKTPATPSEILARLACLGVVTGDVLRLGCCLWASFRGIAAETKKMLVCISLCCLVPPACPAVRAGHSVALSLACWYHCIATSAKINTKN